MWQDEVFVNLTHYAGVFNFQKPHQKHHLILLYASFGTAGEKR